MRDTSDGGEGARAAIGLDSLDAIARAAETGPAPSAETRAAAAERQARLTKPAGALGRLEDLAIWFAGWRGDPRPQVARAQALVFAGRHGVADRGVSPYPSHVTDQMVATFRAGGGAINQLADLLGVRLSISPLRLDRPTADFTAAPAMSEAEFVEAVQLGWASVAVDADALVLGEMGIGNTTAAAALAALLLGGAAEDWTGPGAGAVGATFAAKLDTVRAGLSRHAAAVAEAGPRLGPLEAIRRVGGREMAAILGACLRARRLRAPLILDGFIATASVAPLARIAPGALDHCLAGHRSAEPGHRRLLEALGLTPLLDLGMRLGEGSGAIVALGVLQSALACHSGMSTFEEAGVDGPA